MKTKKELYFNLGAIGLLLVALAFLFAPVISVEGMGDNSFIDLMSNRNGVHDLFVPITVYVLTAVSMVLIGFTTMKKELVNYAFFALIISFLMMLFYPQIIMETNGLEAENNATHGWGFYVYLFLVVVVLGYLLYLIFNDLKLTSREIPEIAIFVSLALVLDKVPKIQIGATGGSISLTMLPLFIIALRFSFLKSFIAIGVVYGIISCQLDGYGFQTYPFDYLLGYGLISIASLFRNLILNNREKKLYLAYIFLVVAVLLGGVGRLFGSTLSSMVLYGYDLGPALSYNILYIGPSTLLAVVFLAALLIPFQKIADRYPID